MRSTSAIAALTFIAATSLCVSGASAKQDYPGSSPPPAVGTWESMVGSPQHQTCGLNLMHNGNVLVQRCDNGQWYRLTPDSNGSYVHGTWSLIASMPPINGNFYSPFMYDSVVLPDGRLLIEGGKWNDTYRNYTPVWTNMGAVYSQSTNTWTPVSPPSGVAQIGNSPSASLKDGRFLLGTCCDSPTKDFLFNARTLTWSATGAPAGSSQYGQGYTLLPTGRILTLNASGSPGTQFYSWAQRGWTTGSSIPATLADTCGSNMIGPAVVRGNNTVVAFGADSCGINPVPTAIRDNTTGQWSVGPTLPTVCGHDTHTKPCDLADAPAVQLPNGNILFAASSGYCSNILFDRCDAAFFFEMTLADNTISQVAAPQVFFNGGAWSFTFLVLPTGQIMTTHYNIGAVVYDPAPPVMDTWRPVVSAAPSNVTRGSTYTITGSQLNGRSAGAYKGGDFQSFTNFPLVRVVNNATGQVVYGNTSGFSDFSIAENAPGSFNFTLPSRTQTGAATLYVVADGIASNPLPVTIH